jgi:hypothetical protein
MGSWPNNALCDDGEWIIRGEMYEPVQNKGRYVLFTLAALSAASILEAMLIAAEADCDRTARHLRSRRGR